MAEATTLYKTSQIKTHLNELTKVHNAYDAQGRIEYTYTAKADATNGAHCLCTRFSYSGLTARIVFAKEYDSTWDSSWDVF